jgi:hypothetical protein
MAKRAWVTFNHKEKKICPQCYFIHTFVFEFSLLPPYYCGGKKFAMGEGKWDQRVGE